MDQQSIYLDTDTCQAILPWREYKFPVWWIWAVTCLFSLLIALLSLSEPDRASDYLVAAGGVAIVLPVLLFGFRFLFHKWLKAVIVVIDKDRFAGANAYWWTPFQGNWSEITTIAHVHSMLGRSFRPIECNLLLFGRNGRARMSLPPLNESERLAFFEILTKIARRHRIELVFDHTDEGNRRIRELPWI